MFQNTLNSSPLKGLSQLTFLFKPNATMNYMYHDSLCHNNDHNNLDSYFSFLKPPLWAFTFIYILKIIQLMKMRFTYGFSTCCIPLNILIIYGKDPNLKTSCLTCCMCGVVNSLSSAAVSAVSTLLCNIQN